MRYFVQMLEKARDVMQNAYSPYSHFKVGACLRVEGDQFFVGCNVENASYGLTVCAEGSAICAMVGSGCRRILEVVVIGSGEVFCAPCGACRQRLYEFADPSIKVHMCNMQGQAKMQRLDDLLPNAFWKRGFEKND